MVRLGVNRFGKVVNVTSEQTDMQGELDSLDLEGMAYADAVTALVESGYLGGTDVDAVISADASGQEDALVQTTTTCLSESGCSGTCNGNRYGRNAGNGSGNGNGSGSQSASDDDTAESGTGNGSGTCDGNGSGSGSGVGSGNGSGTGSATGSGNGNGNGNGNRGGND